MGSPIELADPLAAEHEWLAWLGLLQEYAAAHGWPAEDVVVADDDDPAVEYRLGAWAREQAACAPPWRAALFRPFLPGRPGVSAPEAGSRAPEADTPEAAAPEAAAPEVDTLEAAAPEVDTLEAAAPGPLTPGAPRMPETWDARFEMLEKVVDKLGRLPWSHDCARLGVSDLLASWAMRLRPARDSGIMSKSQKDRVDGLGRRIEGRRENAPVSAWREDRWDAQYERLRAHVAQTGDVSGRFDRGKIFSWVRAQRTKYVRFQLAPRRVAALKELGVPLW